MSNFETEKTKCPRCKTNSINYKPGEKIACDECGYMPKFNPAEELSEQGTKRFLADFVLTTMLQDLKNGMLYKEVGNKYNLTYNEVKYIADKELSKAERQRVRNTRELPSKRQRKIRNREDIVKDIRKAIVYGEIAKKHEVKIWDVSTIAKEELSESERHTITQMKSRKTNKRLGVVKLHVRVLDFIDQLNGQNLFETLIFRRDDTFLILTTEQSQYVKVEALVANVREWLSLDPRAKYLTEKVHRDRINILFEQKAIEVTKIQ